MLFNPRKYWAAVRQTEIKLGDGDVFSIVSIANEMANLKGGVITEVDRRGAAEAIVSGTHRLCTPEEVEADKARRAPLQAFARCPYVPALRAGTNRPCGIRLAPPQEAAQ